MRTYAISGRQKRWADVMFSPGRRPLVSPLVLTLRRARVTYQTCGPGNNMHQCCRGLRVVEKIGVPLELRGCTTNALKPGSQDDLLLRT